MTDDLTEENKITDSPEEEEPEENERLRVIADLTAFFNEEIKKATGEDLSKMTTEEFVRKRLEMLPSLGVREPRNKPSWYKKMISPKEIFETRKKVDKWFEERDQDSESEQSKDSEGS